MAAIVPPTLRLLDALSAAGVGLGLALVYDFLRLFAGRGKVRIFCCDIFLFILAAVSLISFSLSQSYTGQLRWYMLVGALCGYFACLEVIAPVTHWIVEKILFLVRLPFLLLWNYILHPIGKIIQQKNRILRLFCDKKVSKLA